MPLADTLNRKPGDILKSDDWNIIIKEIDRLETAKINRDGADTLKGPLTIAEALNANSNVTIKGSLSIVVPQPQEPSGQILVLGPTNASNLRLGYHQDYSWIQSHGSKPLLINRLGNNIGIGSTINPVARLDIASASRTGTHPTAVKGLYITGDFNADNDGVEFRHSSGTQGIGFGFNTIYAAGSNGHQDLGLKPKGTGEVTVSGNLSVSGIVKAQALTVSSNLSVTNVLEIGTPPLARNTGGNRDWMQKGIKINWDSDSLFIGLKDEGSDRKDAVIAWGDNPQDDLRFINVLAGGDVQGKELMRIKPSGNVSLGSLTVNERMSVTQGVIQRGGDPITTTADLGLYSQLDGRWIRFVTKNAPFHFFSDGGAGTNPMFSITQGGNVGIGIAIPDKGKLHIEGFVNYQHPNGYRYFVNRPDSNSTTTGFNAPYSLYASAFIGASEFNAFSDLRIKEIKGTSDSQADLQTLLQIQVTDYYYKDKIAKGNRPKKKVIGQQIATVYPQAVSTHVDTVPDILEFAIIAENWVTLNNHNLKTGDKVKIFWNDNDSQLFTVEDIKTDQFKISLNHTGDIFVYGREVDDFHVVDYDALSMLHISATQELYKIIKKLEGKINEKINA